MKKKQTKKKFRLTRGNALPDLDVDVLTPALVAEHVAAGQLRGVGEGRQTHRAGVAACVCAVYK